ncbi:membrane-associated protein, putative [Bodo saltans]|uniref:Membrane-associated protein, putative n=1 Tax=Bodo saltans TaxID=75058 RepID=A0A0S4IMZ9_BODSA|nr:membrane-associated protein, putative [Bodo saltans]|eukprot:CUE73231.1 membrane-associated protein, putative [Bodo saltans]
MSQYNELVAPESEDQRVLLDPRAIYVSLSFVISALSTSLFVFLLMERFSSSSFLVLQNKLSIFNVLTAVVLFFIVFLATISVIAVWIRNRRLLSIANGLAVLFALALGLAIVWTTFLEQGTFHDELESGFNALNMGRQCPSLGDAKCCGWATTCAANCTHVDKLCSAFVRQNVEDYSERVLPIAGIVLGAHCVGLILVWNSKKWRMSVIPSIAAE